MLAHENLLSFTRGDLAFEHLRQQRARIRPTGTARGLQCHGAAQAPERVVGRLQAITTLLSFVHCRCEMAARGQHVA
jgi:hypothetical protein